MSLDVFAPKQEVRRDRYSRYLVVPPQGGKPVGYTRATTVAKALDDTSSLMQWGERMTALGLAARPDLLALVATTGDDKQALNRLCERAKEAGGATARRDLGTALHSMIEQSYTDAAYTVPAPYAADVAAVRAALTAAGYEVADGMHERMVVLDRHQIAGTFDLLLRRDNTLHMADIKTGASISYGALAFAVQLSVYAQADALYAQGEAKDGSQDIREPMPAVDRSTAVIIHVEPGSGRCDVHHLDIATGAEALEVAMAVRKFRTVKGLLVPATLVSAPESNGPQPSTTAPSSTPPTGVPVVAAQPTGAKEKLRARVGAMRAAGHIALVGAHWPRNADGTQVPGLAHATHAHTDDELAAIDAALWAAEGAVGAEFPPDDGAPLFVKPAGPEPVTLARPTPDDGGQLDAEFADVLRKVAGDIKAAAPAKWAWIAAMLRDTRQYGHVIHLTERPTARTGALMQALFALAIWHEDDAIVRALLAQVTGSEQALHPTISVAEFFGTLTIAEADALHARATSDVRVTYADDGRALIAA